MYLRYSFNLAFVLLASFAVAQHTPISTAPLLTQVGKINVNSVSLAIKSRFEQHDLNKDGLLNEVEFKAFLDSRDLREGSVPNLARNPDDNPEKLTGQMKSVRKTERHQPRLNFESIDSNDDGLVDRAELASALRKPSKPPTHATNKHNGEIK